MPGTSNPKRKLSLGTIFFTVFLDLVGLGIVIPIFAPLFLNHSSTILPAATPDNIRSIILGILLASYPLAQFFGAPLLGGWSDRVGRKKALVVSLIGTVIGYVIFAMGIVMGNIYLLFAGRIMDGFTGGNISIAMSAIADQSDETSRARNFGLVGMAFGLGFILGPFIGGKLADPTIVSWFNDATPFWFAAILSTINILMVIWRFRETLHTSVRREMSLLTGFHNIAKAFTIPNLRTMFIVVFFLTLGFNFFTQFFQVFLYDKFSFTQSNIGDIFAYAGIWIALAQGVIIRPLSRRFSPTQIFSYSALILGIALPVLLVPDKAIYLYMVLPFVAVANGLTQPNMTAIISGLSSKESQGEALGINQSIQSLGQAIPPIIAGFIVAIDRSLPIMVSGAFTLLAWFLFVTLFRNKSHTTSLSL
ncbi:MAG: MFS transporter [Candidatus Peribacteraceae bacterium]|nr:MFS transporter [Candidatus Peribacteraceae bacterium]